MINCPLARYRLPHLHRDRLNPARKHIRTLLPNEHFAIFDTQKIACQLDSPYRGQALFQRNDIPACGYNPLRETKTKQREQQ